MAKGHRSQIKRERNENQKDLPLSYLMQEFPYRRLVTC